jgi:hypothetical protein
MRVHFMYVSNSVVSQIENRIDIAPLLPIHFIIFMMLCKHKGIDELFFFCVADYGLTDNLYDMMKWMLVGF